MESDVLANVPDLLTQAHEFVAITALEVTRDVDQRDIEFGRLLQTGRIPRGSLASELVGSLAPKTFGFRGVELSHSVLLGVSFSLMPLGSWFRRRGPDRCVVDQDQPKERAAGKQRPHGGVGRRYRPSGPTKR